MYKFLLKLAFIIMGLYILSQIPFFQSYSKAIVDSFYQKVGNVTKEVDRVKGKVDEAKNKIDETKQAVDNIATGVVQTGQNVEAGLTKAKTAIDSVSSALTQETPPKTDTPPVEQKPATK